MDEFKLCYVDGCWAYFTTQALADQWGDDWNDAPYEHNAGDPYTWRPDSDVPEYKVKRVAFWSGLETPESIANGNSHYSVQDINAGAIPWLSSCSYDNPKVYIRAVVTLKEFIDAIHEAIGEVYLPVSQ